MSKQIRQMAEMSETGRTDYGTVGGAEGEDWMEL